jgi:hypothetical protein
MKKILWVKFGWSDYYRGGPVDGNFGWLKDQRGKKDEGRGGEAFNFMPAQDGNYYCYVPPAREQVPRNADNTGWTVVCLAKNPKFKGIHVVGWYENATLIGKMVAPHPAAPDNDAGYYCIKSKSVYFVPPEDRIKPFSDTSVRQGKYSFLSGPDVDVVDNKRRVLGLLERTIAALEAFAVHNPNEKSVPDPEVDPNGPLAGYFGPPENRKKVEKAAEQAVIKYYSGKGFNAQRVAHLPCGYDYIFTKKDQELYVEVKGTSGSTPRFFLTRNEHNARLDHRWRLGMVTNALDNQSRVAIYNSREFKKAFELEPYLFIGEPIIVPDSD